MAGSRLGSSQPSGIQEVTLGVEEGKCLGSPHGGAFVSLRTGYHTGEAGD